MDIKCYGKNIFSTTKHREVTKTRPQSRLPSVPNSEILSLQNSAASSKSDVTRFIRLLVGFSASWTCNQNCEDYSLHSSIIKIINNRKHRFSFNFQFLWRNGKRIWRRLRCCWRCLSLLRPKIMKRRTKSKEDEDAGFIL